MRTLVSLLAIGLTAAPAAAAPLARLGQTVQIDGPAVRPLKVVEDSRCPADVTCVWAGRVVVRVAVSGGRWRRIIDLTLGDNGVPVADGTLRLVSVTPARQGGVRLRPAVYRFGFAFAGGL